MSTYDQIIDRSGASALIPVQESREIIEMIPNESVFLRHAVRMPDMTSKQTSVPVMAGDVDAYFVNGDNGLKQTSKMSWDKVFINAEELAVIVPIPEAVLDDSSYDIWAQVRPRIAAAFARKIDQAALFSTDKPTSWPVGLVAGAIAANQSVEHSKTATGSDLYTELFGEGGVVSLVEDKGLPVNTFIGSVKTKSMLRGAQDLNGQPIFTPAYSNGSAGAFRDAIAGVGVEFVDPRVWDDTTGLLLAGDFSLVRYAMRQDISYKLLTEATITNASGEVVYNLAQMDMVALRAVMRIGWALPKPFNTHTGQGASSYYPFAVLKPAGE